MASHYIFKCNFQIQFFKIQINEIISKTHQEPNY